MKTRTRHLVGALSASTLVLGMLAVAQTANAGIQNTRHNLGSGSLTTNSTTGTRAALDGTSTGFGDVFTLATKEICVFCHTPHGSNTTVDVPLWNKASLVSTVYTTYQSGTLQSAAPTNLAGHMSLACLSCHDGTQAMDNVINQPGQGGFNKNNYLAGARIGQGTINADGSTAPGAPSYNWYAGSNNVTGAEFNAGDTNEGKLITGAGVDFIGTDLSNDHPIGMQYAGGGCTTAGVTTGCNDSDFFAPRAGLNGMYEVTGANAGTAGAKTNMRIYGSTLASATVECGSCHDPHTDAQPTFLRTSNAGSGVCLTCHNK